MRHKRWPTILVVLALAVLGLRLALPYAIRAYANRELARLPDYNGRVDRVGLSLVRGAIRFEGLRLHQAGETNLELATIDGVELDWDWSELLRGRVLAQAFIDRPVARIVISEVPEREVAPPGPDWRARLQALAPIRLSRVVVRDGALALFDETRDFRAEAFLDRIQAEARGLTNEPTPHELLPASMTATARLFGSGDARLGLRFDPLAEQPTFELNASIEEMPVTALNPLLRSYANLDAERGTVSFYVEAAAQEGRVRGYSKPMFEDLRILRWRGPGKDEGLAREAAAELLARVLRHQPTGRIAARIPFEGPIGEPGVDLWTAVVSVLRNAFVSAIKPGVENRIKLERGDGGGGGGRGGRGGRPR